VSWRLAILRSCRSDRAVTGAPPPPRAPARTLRRAGWQSCDSCRSDRAVTGAPPPHRAPARILPGCPRHPARADGRRRKPQAVGLSTSLTVANPALSARRVRRRRARPRQGGHGRISSYRRNPAALFPPTAPPSPRPLQPPPGPHQATCQWHPARSDAQSARPGVGLSTRTDAAKS
jgi:hypothetical protein